MPDQQLAATTPSPPVTRPSSQALPDPRLGAPASRLAIGLPLSEKGLRQLHSECQTIAAFNRREDGVFLSSSVTAASTP